MPTIQLSIRPSLWRVIFVSSIPWASYFRANHLILHPLMSFFLCRPYNSPWVHRFEELFLCSPSIGRVIFVPTIQLSYPSIPLTSYFLCRPSLGESYFHADHLILHPLASYFNVYHITLHMSIPLASYFCVIHPLGKLFSCRPFNSPVFGELFSCHPSLRRVIFVLSIPWASYFRAYYLILHLCRVIFVLTI